jgi:hypothetical protein
MKKTLVLGFVCLVVTAGISAAEREIGLELQAYPTGVVTSVGAKVPLEKDGRFLTFRVGYNEADRDDEKGGGPGISAGWRRSFSNSERGWFAGARADLWFLEIDWIDLPGTPGQTSGADVGQGPILLLGAGVSRRF